MSDEVIPKNDSYEQMQNHVRRKLMKTHLAIRCVSTDISVSSVDAGNLKDVNRGHLFDRIEVSNIADILLSRNGKDAA
jgi:hypothetical protein